MVTSSVEAVQGVLEIVQRSRVRRSGGARKSGSRTGCIAKTAARAAHHTLGSRANAGGVRCERYRGLTAGQVVRLTRAGVGDCRVLHKSDRYIVGAGCTEYVVYRPTKHINPCCGNIYARGGRRCRTEVGCAGAADLRPSARADARRVARHRSRAAAGADGLVVACVGDGRKNAGIAALWSSNNATRVFSAKL